MNALHCLCKTCPDIGMLLLRVGMGAAMLPYGIMKVQDFAGTTGFMTGAGIPYVIAVLVILGESIGAIALILGLFTRFCATSLSIIMIGAIVITFGKGYMMGYATPLLFLIGYIPLIINGGGAFSLDRLIAGKACPACVDGSCAKK